MGNQKKRKKKKKKLKLMSAWVIKIEKRERRGSKNLICFGPTIYVHIMESPWQLLYVYFDSSESIVKFIY